MGEKEDMVNTEDAEEKEEEKRREAKGEGRKSKYGEIRTDPGPTKLIMMR